MEQDNFYRYSITPNPLTSLDHSDKVPTLGLKNETYSFFLFLFVTVV